MHDIGLVTRPISGAFALPSTTVPATVRSLSGGDSSSKTSCHSVSDETACTEATVLSPEPTKLDELRCRSP